jgi:hypothetical protein
VCNAGWTCFLNPIACTARVAARCSSCVSQALPADEQFDLCACSPQKGAFRTCFLFDVPSEKDFHSANILVLCFAKRESVCVCMQCVCVGMPWWWWWWGVCVCVCVQWVRGYLCHRNVALPRRCTFSGPTIYTLTRREGLCLCFFGGFLPSRPGVDGSECEHSQKEKWPFYGRPLPPLPGWRPMSSFSRSCSCDTT